MDIKCKVTGQKLEIVTPIRHFPRSSEEFVRFLFTFTEDWDGLLTFAQFRQGGNYTNRYLDTVTVTEDGVTSTYQAVTLPGWPKPGPLTMTLYGTGNGTVIGTTNFVMLHVDPTGLIENAETSDMDETLYQQLVNRVIGIEAMTESIPFVTPEQFGAKGDGETDDAPAFELALKSGARIICNKDHTYFIGSAINHAGGGDMDFNGAKLKIGQTITFSAPEIQIGNKKYQYAAGATDISVDTGKIESGIFRSVAIAEGEAGLATDDDIFYEDSSVTYWLGFSSAFTNAKAIDGNPHIKLEASFPASFTGWQYIYPYTPVTIKNIGDIIPADPDAARIAFLCKGCYVEISNCNANDYGGMNLFDLLYCKVNIRNCRFCSSDRPDRGGETNYYYAITIGACSNWVIRDVCGINAWHSITTGYNVGVSQNGIIDHCILRGVRSKRDNEIGYSYVEHRNTINTKIIDSAIENCIFCNGRVIRSSLGNYFGVWPSRKSIYKRNTVFDDCSFTNTTAISVVSYLGVTFLSDMYCGDVTFNHCTFDMPATGYLTPFINVAGANFNGHRIIGGVLTFDNCTVKTRSITKGSPAYSEYRPLILGRRPAGDETDNNIKAIFGTCHVKKCNSISGPFASGFDDTDGIVNGHMGGMLISCTNTNFTQERAGTFQIAYGNVQLRDCSIFATPINHDMSNSNIVCINCLKKNNTANQKESQYGCRERAFAGTGAADSYGIFKYTELEDVVKTPVPTVYIE